MCPENRCTGDFRGAIFRARYYKPDLGRFWTMDSYEGDNEDPASLHKYLYCHGDGVNFSDPSGYYEGLGGLAVTMGSGAILGGFSAAAVDIAKGRAVTPLSVVQGAMWGAFLGPFAVEYQAVRVGLGVLSVEFSGLTAYEVFTDPHSSSAQKTMALGMVVASVYGTQVAMQYSRNPSIALPKVPYEGSMPQAKTTSVPVEIPISVKPG